MVSYEFGLIFQQYNAPIHRDKMVQEWFELNGVTVLECYVMNNYASAVKCIHLINNNKKLVSIYIKQD